MFIGINATFQDKLQAKRAFNELAHRAKSEESVEMLSNSEIYKIKDGKPLSYKRNKSSLKVGISGGILGLTLGVFAFFALNNFINNDQILQVFKFVFLIIGFFGGVFVSSALYYIQNEDNPDIASPDIKNKKAVIKAKIHRSKLKLFERILKEHHANDVFVS
jgi:uncharacterized protein YneF (UPF0154 family)